MREEGSEELLELGLVHALSQSKTSLTVIQSILMCMRCWRQIGMPNGRNVGSVLWQNATKRRRKVARCIELHTRVHD